MIDRQELTDWAARFGVATDQVQRDYLISHVLAALGAETDAEYRFYGGTALCRSYLDGARLSEDIDLLHPRPAEGLDQLEQHVSRAMQREVPDLEWTADERRTGGSGANLRAPGTSPIRLDIGRLGPDHRVWEFEPTDISLRYSDLPPNTVLMCPTLNTFAAMKALAWYDRHTPRDLFDLAGLSDLGALNAQSETLLRRAAGVRFLEVEFDDIPGSVSSAWITELGAQVGALPTPEASAARVLRTVRLLHSEA